jgi:hypothetical protein
VERWVQERWTSCYSLSYTLSQLSTYGGQAGKVCNTFGLPPTGVQQRVQHLIHFWFTPSGGTTWKGVKRSWSAVTRFPPCTNLSSSPPFHLVPAKLVRWIRWTSWTRLVRWTASTTPCCTHVGGKAKLLLLTLPFL